ncbi:MAG: YggS family pyridoxal phosphate-dependent enzyme [Planctomycetes bacterium]|nr:YggS family pyridoxal phosphate-dependent enzyme [Planctomycetota bacterium]
MEASFTDRKDAILARINSAAERAGRKPSEVELVAVAKTATEKLLREAWQAGHRSYGHSRVQPLMAHHAVLPEAAWHLIGPLQRNKSRKAVKRVRMIETLAEIRLAETLNRLASELRCEPLPVLLQVNLQPEDGRPGLSWAVGDSSEPLHAFAQEVLEFPHLQLRGLMTIAAPGAGESELHRHFARLRELSEELHNHQLLPSSPVLSMGMSGDFEIAIEEGATLVRVGRALFPPVI